MTNVDLILHPGSRVLGPTLGLLVTIFVVPGLHILSVESRHAAVPSSINFATPSGSSHIGTCAQRSWPSRQITFSASGISWRRRALGGSNKSRFPNVIVTRVLLEIVLPPVNGAFILSRKLFNAALEAKIGAESKILINSSASASGTSGETGIAISSLRVRSRRSRALVRRGKRRTPRRVN